MPLWYAGRMFMLRGLGRSGGALLRGFRGVGEALCPPPPGYTWNVDHWERLRAGQTPQYGPCCNGGTCQGTTIDHTDTGIYTDPARPAQNPVTTLYQTATWPEIFNGAFSQYLLAPLPGPKIGATGMLPWINYSLLPHPPDLIARDSDAAQKLIATGTVPTCTEGPDVSGIGKNTCYRNLVAPDSLPGMFKVLGVQFAVNEAQPDGSYTKTFIPTPEQRRLIDLLVVWRSHNHYVGGDYDDVGTTSLSMLNDKVGSQESIAQKIANLSSGHDSTAYYWLPNFSLNPIPPTNAEMNGIGGYRKWVARGGYLIDGNYIDGSSIVLNAPITYCKSIMCNCGGRLSCLGAWLGGGDMQKLSSVTWRVYITISQGSPWTYTITLRRNDGSGGVLSDVASFMSGAMKDLTDLVCDKSTQAIVQSQVSAISAEKCTNAKGAICQKGTAGCTCVSPPDAQKEEVQAASGLYAKVCSSWNTSWQPQPTWTMPTTPPPYPTIPTTPPLQIPLWLIALFGLGAGAFAFSRR